MVTKHKICDLGGIKSSVLAKIFMVTKLYPSNDLNAICSVLAKIFMVTKPLSEHMHMV